MNRATLLVDPIAALFRTELSGSPPLVLDETSIEVQLVAPLDRVLTAIAGAISASSWLFAAFVGVGKAVAPALGFTGFLVLYLAVVSLAIGVSLAFIRPILAARMLRPEPVHTVIAEHARQLLGPFADDYLAENGVRAADIERNPARAVVRIGKLLEEIDPAHREAFDRMTARKLRGELAEAA